MKYFSIITLLFFFFSLYSCCCEPPSCQKDSDCTSRTPVYCGYSKQYDKKICMKNECKDKNGKNKKLCGLGTCIPCSKRDESCNKVKKHTNYACDCPEGTVLYDEHPDEAYGNPVCVPKCDSNYTGVCEKAASGEFKDQIGDYIHCDVELGHCSKYCKGDGSCPSSFTCDGFFCSKINCEKNEDCSSDGTYVCGIKGKCTYNPCNKKEPPFCGFGKCKGGGDPHQTISDELYYGISYTCECDDNTVLTEKGVCMLKCTKDETCKKFKLPDYPEKNFYCNKEKGHCEEVPW